MTAVNESSGLLVDLDRVWVGVWKRRRSGEGSVSCTALGVADSVISKTGIVLATGVGTGFLDKFTGLEAYAGVGCSLDLVFGMINVGGGGGGARLDSASVGAGGVGGGPLGSMSVGSGECVVCVVSAGFESSVEDVEVSGAFTFERIDGRGFLTTTEFTRLNGFVTEISFDIVEGDGEAGGGVGIRLDFIGTVTITGEVVEASVDCVDSWTN